MQLEYSGLDVKNDRRMKARRDSDRTFIVKGCSGRDEKHLDQWAASTYRPFA